ncbi:MAG: hypothetical protein WB566_03510 [Terriglobales bacterium]
MSDKAKVVLDGTVERIIESQGHPDLAQIAVDGADEISQIRIANSVTDRNGDDLQLKKGAKVQVIVEAGKASTTAKL